MRPPLAEFAGECLFRLLEDLEDRGEEVGIGLIGAGKMGKSIIHQAKLAKGVDIVAIIEIEVERALRAAEEAGYKCRIVRNGEEANRVVEDGFVAITSDASILDDMLRCDVVIDATGIVEVGAEAGYRSITRGRDFVMMNAEADATFGPMLSKLAELSGAVYTGDLGDEPGTVMHYLYNPFKSLGFRVIAAGKGKNNPLSRHANPDTVAEDAERRRLNPRILASFVDGTKTMVEMTILSNATGLKPDRTGMHGPKSDVRGLSRIFRLKDYGGILESEGVVDYVIGIAPGVFIVVDVEDEEVRENLRYLMVGDEPPYVFYRPYHLPGTETILTAIWATIYRTPIIAPIGHYSDTVTYAKRDLSPGETLDGIGGYTVYGMIENRERASEMGLLPIGLSEGATVKRSIRRDEPITFDDVEVKENLAYKLWSLQEHVIG